MAAIIGIVMLGAIVTGMVYLVAAGIGRTPVPTWRKDAAYRERPCDRYVTISMDC